MRREKPPIAEPPPERAEKRAESDVSTVGKSVGPYVKGLCDVNGISCSSTSARFGGELLYSLQPALKMNPWIGYGAGLSVETIQLGGTGGRRVDIDFFGIEWARLLAGLDLRINEGIGLGAFVDLSLGTFVAAHSSADDSTINITDSNQKTHVWLSIGARAILFP